MSAICEEREFDEFILPDRNIRRGASRVTGFTLSNGQLYRNGEPLDTISLFKALNSFMNFLYSFRYPVILAAHNARGFDAPVLIRVLKRFSFWHKFQKVVSGFLDTLDLSRDLFPELDSHSLQNLVCHFLQKTYDAHNSLEDARMLEELFNKWKRDRWDISNATRSLSELSFKKKNLLKEKEESN